MTDTPTGETVVVGDSKTTVDTPATPTPPVVEDKVQENAVEKELRLQLEKAKLRENQLANQLKAKEDAEAEAQTKALEENNEFKNLYEQEKAKREEIENAAEAEKLQKELSTASTELFADYSDEVKALAEEAGMTLSDTTDEAKEALKTKLDKIATMVTKTEKVAPNNPGAPTGKADLSADELKVVLKDEKTFHQLMVDKYPGIANMTKQR